MSRLVCGDDLSAHEIRVYAHDGDDGSAPTERLADPAPADCRTIEYDCIDFLDFAPLVALAAAQNRAQATIAQAQVEAEDILQQARRAGAALALQEGRDELIPSLAALAEAGQALLGFEERLVSCYAPQLVQLALEIAEKVTGRAVEVDATIVAMVVERAKKEVVYAKQIRIWLHPKDLKSIEELRPDLLRVESASGRVIETVAALDVGRGGCRLETESGIVDATLPTQFAEIRRQLLDHDPLGGNGAGPLALAAT